jgi:hypothetical protein
VTKADLVVERGAQRLQHLADKAAARGDGVGEWLAEELRNDAAFLRKLKPSLIRARAKGQAAKGAEPEAAPPPSAPSSPQLGKRSKKKRRKGGKGGPPPIAIVGAAFVAGVALAKVIDWRGHGHPRD